MNVVVNCGSELLHIAAYRSAPESLCHLDNPTPTLVPIAQAGIATGGDAQWCATCLKRYFLAHPGAREDCRRRQAELFSPFVEKERGLRERGVIQ